jgi:hypothetical protein
VAHCRKWLRQPARGKRAARLGGAAHWRCGPRKTERGERGTGTTPVPATSLRCGARWQPGQLRPSGDRRAGAQDLRKDGKHQSSARGGQERARTPEGRNASSVAGNGGTAGRTQWRLIRGGGGAQRCVRRRGGDGGA